jgi:Cytochrome c biogenesis factor
MIPIVVVAIVAASGFWVYLDATKNKIGKVPGPRAFFNMSAWRWACFTYALWIVGLPCYLLKRGDLIVRAKATPVEEKNRFGKAAFWAFGTLVVLGLMIYGVLSGGSLPSCDAPVTVGLAEKALRESQAIQALGIQIGRITVPVEKSYDTARGRRVCRAILRSARGEEPLYYTVEWHDEARGLIWVQILPSIEDQASNVSGKPGSIDNNRIASSPRVTPLPSPEVRQVAQCDLAAYESRLDVVEYGILLNCLENLNDGSKAFVIGGTSNPIASIRKYNEKPDSERFQMVRSAINRIARQQKGGEQWFVRKKMWESWCPFNDSLARKISECDPKPQTAASIHPNSAPSEDVPVGTQLPAAPSPGIAETSNGTIPASQCARAHAPELGDPLSVALKLSQEKAAKAIDISVFQQAAAKAEEAATVDPQCSEAWSLLAYVRYRSSYDICGRGDYSSAIEAARKALSLDQSPKIRAAILRNIARIAAAQLKWDEAERLLNESLSLDPGSHEAQSWLGDLGVAKNPRPEFVAAVEKVMAGEIIVEDDIASFSYAEMTNLLNAPLARNGRRLNAGPADWMFFCDGSPIGEHAKIDPNASRNPVRKGTPDFENMRIITAARKQLKP